VEILYLSRELVRAGQFLTLLADKIEEKKVQRLVLDSASHLVTSSTRKADELKELLYKLVIRFKTLGVTSIFTLESRSMFSTDSVTDHDFSPISDNLLMLRYIKTGKRIDPSLTVVKTRGSAHDRGTYIFEIGKGGMRVVRRLEGRSLHR
jgi:circadian clock protein KaiC